MGEVENKSLEFWTSKIVNDPELLPVIKDGKIVTTYCNIAVQRICRGMDYHNLDGMLANDMREYCRKNWIIPYGEPKEQLLAAYNAAQIGDIAILAQLGKPHGHVAVVAPKRPMIFSGRWGLYVPHVANVGKRNEIMGANYAFTEIPEVYLLGRTIL